MKVLITGGSGFIGTNLIDHLKNNYSLVNIDIKPPINSDHKEHWRECDILNKSKLFEIFSDLQPDFLIHLAARADVEGKTLDDYQANTAGTKNVLDAVINTPSVKRIIVTSTQFVNQYHGVPKHDEDFAPHTVYGESKVITEKLTRQVDLKCCWTIIRPTNIWGPWHWRYPHEFWKVIAKGKYLHPSNQKVTRSYGYVGNVCWQITKILELEERIVNKNVFYVGDEAIDILDWVNLFSKYQIGKNVKQVNKNILKVIALFGDLLKVANIKFPLTSSRLKSMTTSNEAPMSKTFQVLGKSPYSLEEGVKETIKWLKIHYPNLVKV